MRLRDVVATTAGALILLAPAPAMGDTLIGFQSQGNAQAADSAQSATLGSGGGLFSGPGEKFIPGSSKPKITQNSSNFADNAALIGGGGGGTLIGNGSQQNTQGIASEQAAKKGTQNSTNIESGTQVIGLAAGDTIIGNPAQASAQAENSLQTAASPPGSGTTVILGTNKSPLTENSFNLLVSCQLVIGAPASVC